MGLVLSVVRFRVTGVVDGDEKEAGKEDEKGDG
jgi:hypothetical protein